MRVLRFRGIPAPGGCRWCGTLKEKHYHNYVASAGWHHWEQPTQAQILARMKARRPKEVVDDERGHVPQREDRISE